MKTILMFLVLTPSLVFAQKVDMKDIDAGSEDTTISISKGKKAAAGCEAIWEVAEGSSDVNGDSAIMAKDANESWKKACKDWEKQFRNDNKENKIISMSCGKANCSSDAGGKVCTSQATYKIKTKLN